MDGFALDTRSGLPADLRELLARYPRDVWKGHANLGEMATFWLARHDMFRELGTSLGDATLKFRNGDVAAEDFARFFAPRLQFLLQQLDAHHHVEDAHYFPVFRAAEATLGRGFDILENDHETIHRAIADSAEAANGFLQALSGGKDALSRAGDTYTDVNARLLRILTRHLADEEDLIVPLVLDRGERALGVG